MRKAWIYQRNNRPGWYVGWYDSAGKKRSKRCPNKSLADRFARRIEHQYNEDIYPDPIAMPWDELVAEYIHYKEFVRKLASESLRSARTTLAQFRQLHGPITSTRLDQRLIDGFVAHRLETTGSRATVNKDLRNLRTFCRWSIRNRYMGSEARRIDWTMQKETKRPVRALTKNQLTNLLIAAKKYRRYGDAWYVRVLLAVSSGLRESDIEKMRFSDIDFETASVCTASSKTGKVMPSRPLHPAAVAALSRYHAAMPAGRDALFIDRFHSSKWKRIRNAAGLPRLKFHDLRKSFASFVAQAGFSTSVAQDLLEHSTPRLTHEVYTDVDPVRRQAVESVPIEDITELSDREG